MKLRAHRTDEQTKTGSAPAPAKEDRMMKPPAHLHKPVDLLTRSITSIKIQPNQCNIRTSNNKPSKKMLLPYCRQESLIRRIDDDTQNL